MTATSISEETLAPARENADRLGLMSRVEFQLSDPMLYVSHVYDLIVATPYNLDRFMEGDLTEMIGSLQTADLQERLKESAVA